MNGDGQKLQKKSFLGPEVGTNRPKLKEKNPKWVNLRYISNFEVTVTLNTMKFETFYEIIFYSYTPHAQGHCNEAIYYVTRLDETTSNW